MKEEAGIAMCMLLISVWKWVASFFPPGCVGMLPVYLSIETPLLRLQKRMVMLKFWLNVFLVVALGVLSVFYFSYLLNGSIDSTNWSKVNGILQDLIASLLFLILVFYLIKPSIRIAKVLAESPHEDGHLRFKVVNCSLFRAYDLNISFFHQKRINISGNDIKSELLHEITSRELAIPFLESGLKAIFDESKRNAAQVRINRFIKDDTIRELLKSESSYIVVHVSVRHSFSGLQSNFSIKYNNLHCIKKGFYNHGFSLDVN